LPTFSILKPEQSLWIQKHEYLPKHNIKYVDSNIFYVIANRMLVLNVMKANGCNLRKLWKKTVVFIEEFYFIFGLKRSTKSLDWAIKRSHIANKIILNKYYQLLIKLLKFLVEVVVVLVILYSLRPEKVHFLFEN